MSDPTRGSPGPGAGGASSGDAVPRETLMRYLDGELSPEERRAFEQALEGSTELQRELAVYRTFHEDLSELRLRDPEGRRGSVWTGVRRRLSRPIGWILVVVGVLVWTFHVSWVYLTSPAASWEKAATSAIVIGILILFATVIGERYQEWQTDPYKDVER